MLPLSLASPGAASPSSSSRSVKARIKQNPRTAHAFSGPTNPQKTSPFEAGKLWVQRVPRHLFPETRFVSDLSSRWIGRSYSFSSGNGHFLSWLKQLPATASFYTISCMSSLVDSQTNISRMRAFRLASSPSAKRSWERHRQRTGPIDHLPLHCPNLDFGTFHNSGTPFFPTIDLHFPMYNSIFRRTTFMMAAVRRSWLIGHQNDDALACFP